MPLPARGMVRLVRGCISTKHPDQAILTKMLEMAGTLGARVQGDDGEEYTDPSQLGGTG